VTAKAQTAVNVSESGYVMGANIDGWVNWDPFERVPELQWPANVAVFSRMDNEDSRVTSLLEAISLPIRSTTWRIDPNGSADEVAQFVSQNLDCPIIGFDSVENTGVRSRDRFSWAQHLEDVASPVNQYGHAVFEQVYRRVADAKDGSRRYAIRKLAPRPQWTLLRFIIEMDGGLKSVEQVAPAYIGEMVYGTSSANAIHPTEIPVNRLVVYTRNMKPGFWQGKSLLRSAYKHWMLKDHLMRIEAAAAERNGMGLPVGTASRDDDQKEVDRMTDIARGLRGGMHSGVGLAQGQSLALLGVSGNLPDIRAAIEFHDTSIALSGLAHFLNLNGGGSYALASVQANTFVQAVQAYAESIRRTATAHVVEDLVDINFGPDVPAPKLVFDDIDADQDSTAAALSMLVTAGLLSPDVMIEQTLRQRLGLPAKPPGEPMATPAVGPAAPPKTPPPTPSGEPASQSSARPVVTTGQSSARPVVTTAQVSRQTGAQTRTDQGRLF
jgi:hypothetical protein